MVVFCHEKNFLNSESVGLKFVFIFSLKESLTIADHKYSQLFQKIMNLYIGDFQLHILGLIFHQLDYLDMHICLLSYLLDISLIKNLILRFIK